MLLVNEMDLARFAGHTNILIKTFAQGLFKQWFIPSKPLLWE